ncbi:hypothetical protein PCNPT3_00715 [Psychromonas sp. CNPT3]|uniref:hypothetical protein n=1 Tax=Psychromonas sp. CNPT3 TaxID=314282 RepID=UPI00006E7067|nr:hypothetical protein [Psychromonas sp. CNPT3]AGH80085.1 hypothetical protein PCNPT3_00715 [Psychromonas sp. CNPT3]
MLQRHFSQLLLLIWKLSSVFVIPLIMFLYVYILQQSDASFTFQTLDQGSNIHKWIVFAIYLLYLGLWKLSNKSVIYYLKRMEY